MARRSKDVRITANNRDKGKVFRITEKPAREAERWAMRAVFACTGGGLNVNQSMLGGGFQALVGLAFQGLLSCSFDQAEPLLDELLTCVEVAEKPGQWRGLFPGDQEKAIEEPATYLTLRKEVVELHLGFSIAAELLTFLASAATEDTSSLSDTPTSQTPLAA